MTESWEDVLRGREQAFEDAAQEFRQWDIMDAAEYCTGRADEARACLAWLREEHTDE